MRRMALVGSRTSAEGGAHGAGLRTYEVSAEGEWTPCDEWAADNPSFAAWSPSGRLAYVVHGDGDRLSTVRVADEGTITPLAQASTEGTNPVHLCVDATGSWLLVVNHSGTLVSFPIGADEALGERAGMLELTGQVGPHADQSGAKPHQVVQDPVTGRFLVPCKGLDAVVEVSLDPATGALSETARTSLRSASGSRHLLALPSGMVYVMGELDSTVTVLRREGETLVPLQVHTTLDPDDVRDSRCGEIAVDPAHRFVYASNRSGAGDHTPGGPGDDTVAVFAIAVDGRLTSRGVYRTGGVRPRHILCLADELIAEHERSDTICRLRRHLDGGLDAPEVVARTGSPVCVILR